MFVCMDVGCILMSGSTDFNDISGPLWMVRTLGNSVGVAISQPRVEVRSASTLGTCIIRCSNSVGVAFSRRRYLQQDNCKNWVGGNHKIENNTYG